MAELAGGTQVELVHSDQRATVTEVGAGLRTYEVGGRPVLDGYAATEMCTAGRGQVLMPWPNRVAGGRYTFDGVEQKLALTEPAAGNANHGLTRWVNWRLTGASAASAVGEYTLHPQPGYPFTLACRVEYALGDGGLTVALAISNVGAGPAPVGMGCHPYLTLGEPVDGLLLQVPASTWLRTDSGGIPVGQELVVRTPYDFSSPRAVGELKLDTAFTDLRRDADGLVRVRLATADGSRAVTLWADGAFGFVQAFTGDTVPQPERRRAGLAVEPMTCAPDAFNSGAGLRVLAPGETLAGTWGLTATG